jgi:hypothetical protein
MAARKGGHSFCALRFSHVGLTSIGLTGSQAHISDESSPPHISDDSSRAWDVCPLVVSGERGNLPAKACPDELEALHASFQEWLPCEHPDFCTQKGAGRYPRRSRFSDTWRSSN